MNSLERVQLALNHEEPDRVPFMNSLTIHGAAVIGRSYPEYYHDPANIARVQEILRKKIGHKDPAVFWLAGSVMEPLLPLIAEIGASGFIVGSHDDLGKIKRERGHKIVLVGNLNNIVMERWLPDIVDNEIRLCCEAAAKGGGYILSDAHGDLPEQVSDEVLYQEKQSVDRWGTYGRSS